MATDSSEGVAVLGYLAVMSRWKWLIIGITVAVPRGRLRLSGHAYASLQRDGQAAVRSAGHHQQSARAEVLQTLPAARHRHGLRDGREQPGDHRRGFELLEGKDTSAGYYVSATQPIDSSGNSSATVVGIEAVSANPQTAADAANATAQAFVDWRRDSTRTPGPGRSDGSGRGVEDLHDPDREGERRVPAAASSRSRPSSCSCESLSSDFTIIAPATVSDGALLASHEAHAGACRSSSAWHSGWGSPSCSSSSTPEYETSGR